MSRTVDEQRREMSREESDRRAINALTDLLQQLRLRAERLSLSEIAARTGWSERTIDRRVAVCRELLGRIGQRRTEGR